MTRIAGVLRTYRLAIVVGIVVLALGLYLWQIATMWLGNEDDAGLSSRSLANLHGYAMRLDPLTGTASSGEITATLQAARRSDTGQLMVRNLPILPPTQVYKMWAVDPSGTVDAAAEFNAPFYGSNTFPVDVITAQLLGVYQRFFVTIEPAGSHDPLPTGKVVMTS